MLGETKARVSGQRRSRNGCMNCRRRKKRCDEKKPICLNCIKISEVCKWGRPLSFKLRNAYTISQGSGTTAMSTLHQKDNESEVNASKRIVSVNCLQSLEQAPLGLVEDEYIPQSFLPDVTVLPTHQYAKPALDDQLRSPQAIPTTNAITPTSGLEGTHVHVRGRSMSALPTAEAHWSVADHNRNHDQYENLQEKPPATRVVDSSETLDISSPLFHVSPMLSDDGIFLPGSAYQELHATLRQHVLYTARSQEPSRRSTPGPECAETPIEEDLDDMSETQFDNAAQENGLSTEVEIDDATEYRLWKNWVCEIADWLDKFDSDRHFARSLPFMAKSCEHLRYAMLALSARQLERKDKSVSASLTLSLYQAAVHLLVPQLHLRDTAILASCVIICVLEMMSCSPQAWRRHLDGCASLIRSMNIRGDSQEGVERALFWCFARMDVCGGLISREPTLIPPEEWTFQLSFPQAVNTFAAASNVDNSACLSSYLSACTIDLLFGPSASSHHKRPTYTARERQEYKEKWTELFAAVEDWYEQRPPGMLPIISQSPSTSQPFPTLLFSNGAAISGNQLHHTTALLMLQNMPKGSKAKHSALWHARRICAIAICNEHHGCWTNSIQPLWIAGQTMSHPTEHQAILNIYSCIERETGWGATWRADDLKQFWGDID